MKYKKEIKKKVTASEDVITKAEDIRKTTLVRRKQEDLEKETSLIALQLAKEANDVLWERRMQMMQDLYE